MKTIVPAVLVTGALVGWFAPDPKSFAGSPPAAADSAAAIAASAQPEPGWGAIDVSLDRQGDGHFYASVRIDSRDYRMLVDTGASVIALTGEDARAMGFRWDSSDLYPVARGAGGVVMGVGIMLGEVSVGDHSARNVDAVIVPEGLPVSLLGQSYLAQVGNVAISHDTLTLSD